MSIENPQKLVILQHGSIPIEWDLDKQLDIMAIPKDNREAFKSLFKGRATTISEQLGSRPNFTDLVKNFSIGFEEVFDMELETSEYSKEERKLESWLMERKYGSDEWNLKL